MFLVQLLCALGFLLSLYASIVERKAKYDKNYRAVCDIKESMSCTKAFTSPFGRLLGISNAVGGLIFYAAFFLLTFFDTSLYLFSLSAFAFTGSLYLAYLSYIKMRNFCVVCTMIYGINFLLLLFSYLLL